MTLSSDLENADLDVKIEGTKLAFDAFITDPMQSSYAKVYLQTLWSAVESIIGDYEHDVAFLNDRVDELQERVSDLSWALNPDTMGQ